MRDFLEQALLAAEPGLDTRRAEAGGYVLFTVFASILTFALGFFYFFAVTKNVDIYKTLSFAVAWGSICIFMPVCIFGFFLAVVKGLAVVLLGGTIGEREAVATEARKLIKAMLETEYLGAAPYRIAAIKRAREQLRYDAQSLGGYLAPRLRGLFNEVRQEIVGERPESMRSSPEVASRLAQAMHYRLPELLGVDPRKLPESWR